MGNEWNQSQFRQPSTTHAYPAINGHPQIVHIQISLPMVAPTGETNAVAPVTAGVKQVGEVGAGQ